MMIIPILLALSATAQQPAALFHTSERCQACHNGLQTPTAEDVSIGGDWRSSMMANAGRDPYWLASVRRETLDHPGADAAIQDKCSTCHMPMHRYDAKHVQGATGRVFESVGDPMAMDGVSCAMCHQISDEGLGDPSTFTGGFHLDANRVYGPYEVDAGRTRVMRSSTAGFEPHQGAHVQSAELCASCHTLYTHALGPDGSETGVLAEQVPYLEWKHSAYQGTQPCQDCHMPEVSEAMPISSTLGQDREFLSRHVFKGGNVLMPRVFAANRAELGVAATPHELLSTAEASQANLQENTAELGLDVVLEEDALRLEVSVTNLAGHKLPTAYPSRRVWLHLEVAGPEGEVFFESGALQADGSIEGNDNDQDPTRYEPHYDVISAADQVQIWEPILGDPDGAVTTGLLRANHYLKDNRILPRGFDKSTAHADVGVYGAAAEDANFVGASDRIEYAIALPEGDGSFRITAELLYQPVGYRWAYNLDGLDTPETDRWSGYYPQLSEVSAVVVATAQIAADRERD